MTVRDKRQPAPNWRESASLFSPQVAVEAEDPYRPPRPIERRRTRWSPQRTAIAQALVTSPIWLAAGYVLVWVGFADVVKRVSSVGWEALYFAPFLATVVLWPLATGAMVARPWAIGRMFAWSFHHAPGRRILADGPVNTRLVGAVLHAWVAFMLALGLWGVVLFGSSWVTPTGVAEHFDQASAVAAVQLLLLGVASFVFRPAAGG